MTTNRKILLLLPLLALACQLTAPIEANTAKTFSSTQPIPSPLPTDPPTLTPTESPQTCTVTAGSLHLRAQPGTDAQVIGYLYAGDVLKILTDPPVDAWMRVTAGDLTGWINSRYCRR